MNRSHIIYLSYLLFFVIFVGSIFVIPLLAFDHDMTYFYDVLSNTCHQKLSRSLCIFSDTTSYWIGDCTAQTGDYVPGGTDRHIISVEGSGFIGYKMPVCARDVGIYVAMLLGALAYPLMRDINDRRVYHAIYLIIAIIPIGFDGGLQLGSDIGILPFAYESTNLIRLITGGIAGFASSIYAIPVLVNMFSNEFRRNKN